MEKNNDIILMALQTIFKCQKCGNCCKIENPIILCQEDIKKIAKYFDMSYKKARINYVRSDGDKLFIKKSKPCMFYDDDKKCTIYEARPYICRAYPFLNEKSDFSVESVPAKIRCPGSLDAAKYYTESWNKVVDYAQKNPDILKELNLLKKEYEGRKNEIIDEMREKLRIKMGLSSP